MRSRGGCVALASVGVVGEMVGKGAGGGAGGELVGKGDCEVSVWVRVVGRVKVLALESLVWRVKALVVV